MNFSNEIIFIIIFLVQLIVILLLIITNHKFKILRRSYTTFMRGNDGKTLERSFQIKFSELDLLIEENRKKGLQITDIYEKLESSYHKSSVVKYDAFLEMGGKLSFALTVLDRKNDGWILNVMHSREGCYTYIKEIVKGESFIELSQEETESLELAMLQDSALIRN